MKVISFSLWGHDAKYCVGAVRNAQLAREIYPGWVTRFYVGKNHPEDIGIQLLQHGNGWEEVAMKKDLFNKFQSRDGLTEVIFLAQEGDWRMMLDRFRPIGEDNVDVMISRDCDSRLSLREKAAVDQWLESDKHFHTMHCHFHHSVPILGGMFGIKKGLFSELSRHAVEWAKTHESRWQVDQDFLKEVVWPIVQNDTMNHADFHTNIWPGISFPTPMTPGHFIGATYDEHDNIDLSQLRVLYG